MKFNIDFPYPFHNITDDEVEYVDLHLTNDELKFQLKNISFHLADKLDVALEISDTQTFYRELFITTEDKLSFTINRKVLGKKTKYSLILVSKVDEEININNQLGYYQKGDCVGVLQKDFVFKSEGLSGLIKVARSNNDFIEYDLTSDWITITMPGATYDKYVLWQNSDDSIPFILASVASNCLQFALIKALLDNHLKSYDWWNVLEKAIESLDYDLDNFSPDEVPGFIDKFLNHSIHGMLSAALPETDIEDHHILS